jgi:hypothetical protein
MVYGRTQVWHSWIGQGEDIDCDYFYELGVQPNNLIAPPTLLINLLHNKYQTPTTCNALMRREVFENIGCFEEPFRTRYEDQVFFAKVLLNAPVYVADEVWAKYRQHAQSCSAKAETQQYYLTRLPFLNWLKIYLLDQHVQDQQVWQTFQRELWQCRHPTLAGFMNQVYTRLSQIRHTFP